MQFREARRTLLTVCDSWGGMATPVATASETVETATDLSNADEG